MTDKMSFEIIKSARASLLLPSRPKTPMCSKLHLKSLSPLSNLELELDSNLSTNPIATINKILEFFKDSGQSSTQIDKSWDILSKISATDQGEEEIVKGLDIIMKFILDTNPSMEMLKTLKNLSYSLKNHKSLTKYGIFKIIDQELDSSLQRFTMEKVIIITEIYRNLASNPQNSRYFGNFFSIFKRNSINSKIIWFNISRICAKLSLSGIIFDEFWISKFKDLLLDNVEFRVF